MLVLREVLQHLCRSSGFISGVALPGTRKGRDAHVGEDGYRLESQPVAALDDPHCDFSAVGHEHTVDTLLTIMVERERSGVESCLRHGVARRRKAGCARLWQTKRERRTRLNGPSWGDDSEQRGATGYSSIVGADSRSMGEVQLVAMDRGGGKLGSEMGRVRPPETCLICTV